MAYLIGIFLALGVAGFARGVGLDRDRAFYPTVMIVIASLYVLFAAIGDPAALLTEGLVGLGFIGLAVAGFKKSGWLVVVALVGHGIFDWVHPHAITNAGVPAWWPAFCGAYDVTAGALLGVLFVRAQSTRPPHEAGP